MADTLNETKVAETASVEQQEVRTFTQEEVDKMVHARVMKEREKFSDYEEMKTKASRFDEIEEASKSELQKATERAEALQSQLDAMTKASEVREIKSKVSSETGVPVSLLTAETEEQCKAQAEAILSFAKPSSYPTVKDGGEPGKVDTRTTSDQFSDWFNNQIR